MFKNLFLPLKHQAKFEADGILHFFNYLEKISIDISYELSAKQTIHRKCQDLLSMKS